MQPFMHALTGMLLICGTIIQAMWPEINKEKSGSSVTSLSRLNFQMPTSIRATNFIHQLQLEVGLRV